MMTYSWHAILSINYQEWKPVSKLWKEFNFIEEDNHLIIYKLFKFTVQTYLQTYSSQCFLHELWDLFLSHGWVFIPKQFKNIKQLRYSFPIWSYIEAMLSIPNHKKKSNIESLLQKETNIFTYSQRIKKCCTLKHLW